MLTLSRLTSLSIVVLGLFYCPSLGAEPLKLAAPAFTASQSCQSSSCHGGGAGKDQSVIWEKKDVHSRAHSILSTTRSARIADALKIGSPKLSARCTVCHAPMKALGPDRLVKGAVADNGVSCENCHGAAEPWLRFHTRTDVTHEQRVAAGLRELTDLYSRANACIACHMNIDSELVKVGHHPEMFFELDGQMNSQPPHYKDEGSWVGPRAWVTGQAVALREMSWRLATKTESELIPRWKALIWLLRKTGATNDKISDTAAYDQVQDAADRMAREVAHTPWSKEKSFRLLKEYTALSTEFRDAKASAPELQRRAELSVLAIDRLWVALKKEGALTSDKFDAALKVLAELSRAQTAFDRVRFAAALEQLEVAIELLPK